MSIHEAMVSDVSTCCWNSPLNEVALMMWDNDCGSIPIVDDRQKPIGMITDRDITMGLAMTHKPLREITAGDVSGDRPVHSCQKSDTITQVLGLMQEQKVRRLPVTSVNGEITGIVSMGDMLPMLILATMLQSISAQPKTC